MKTMASNLFHNHESKCNPAGGTLLACLKIGLFKNCPESKRSKSSQCTFYFDPHHDRDLNDQTKKDMDVNVDETNKETNQGAKEEKEEKEDQEE